MESDHGARNASCIKPIQNTGGGVPPSRHGSLTENSSELRAEPQVWSATDMDSVLVGGVVHPRSVLLNSGISKRRRHLKHLTDSTECLGTLVKYVKAF